MSETGSRLLWPRSSGTDVQIVPDKNLEEVYYYPEPIGRAYVRLNYVSSLNGKVSVNGRSAALGTTGDKLVFRRLRRLADVIMVGAGTVRADGYKGARSSESLQAARRLRGQAAVPPIAVITASADLNPQGPLFKDAWVPPIILTVRSAPPSNVKRLRDANAEVMIVGEDRAGVQQILDALASRKLYRILCEGGPALFGQLFAAGAVDEVCMTLSPQVGGAGQISPDSDNLLPMRIGTVLARDETLLLRYVRKA
jgi:riboflavin biosynthesis pyrimidine reductase